MSNVSSNSVEIVPEPVLWISAAMIGLAVLCTLVRILLGPATPDRIVGVDLLASLVMAGLLISGLASDNPFYLQITLGFAVILFLGTVALSRYLDRPNP
ncbi:MAG: monovalent cation/H+ antiporter complex subunit F [Verrucomicrobiota bacterium JB025]|nr:monovalent cation/H+ antiporter complex subunit F [Verrucomicrobiota bacterium JB025]